jgi:hypothetical protein
VNELLEAARQSSDSEEETSEDRYQKAKEEESDIERDTAEKRFEQIKQDIKSKKISQSDSDSDESSETSDFVTF